MFRLTFFDLCNVWRSIISFHFTWNEVATRFAIGGPASSSSSSAGHWCRPAPLFFFLLVLIDSAMAMMNLESFHSFWLYSATRSSVLGNVLDTHTQSGPPLLPRGLFVADAERKHCRISSLPFSAKRQREREKERERTAGHGRSPAPSAETIVEPDCTTATSEDPQKKSVRQPPTKKNHHHHHHHHNQRWRWHENENEVKKGWSRIRKTKKKTRGEENNDSQKFFKKNLTRKKKRRKDSDEGPLSSTYGAVLFHHGGGRLRHEESLISFMTTVFCFCFVFVFFYRTPMEFESNPIIASLYA